MEWHSPLMQTNGVRYKIMNRREFNKLSMLSAIALSCGASGVTRSDQKPRVAITMDDFSWSNPVKLSAAERNRRILSALHSHSIKAALFVVGGNADSKVGKALVGEWNRAGHQICNHTYSHRNYNDPNMTTAAFAEDIVHAETVLKTFSGYSKLFRFPMLKEGNTAEKRDGLRAFLKGRGYRIGHVTIDNSDWIVDERLKLKLSKDPAADVKPYRDYYLNHIWDRTQYYHELALKVTGRPVSHTLLTHFNLLNGLFLGDLLDMFTSRGWQLIDAQEAFRDPVFASEPNVLPAGESIIWSLAKATGKIDKDLRYPAEDGQYERAAMDKLGL
ncbi:MAG TPA: polysaccharide deacetylase family protein [Pyrinomonadaceae bacterium]|nr:polysaccharide deacetylase family protein [Pyrinomonadaceae bacterium]